MNRRLLIGIITGVVVVRFAAVAAADVAKVKPDGIVANLNALVREMMTVNPAPRSELSPILGDGLAGQAAAVAV